jgi:hypothetical protein
MAYPDTIYQQRELENLPGLTYQPTNKKTLFAEDMIGHGNEITNIENTLGRNPQGTYASVSDRLDNASSGPKLLFELIPSNNESQVDIAGIDILSGKTYILALSLQSTGANAKITFMGDYIMALLWNGILMRPAEVDYTSSLDFLNYTAFGMCNGEFIIKPWNDGAFTVDVNINYGGQRVLKTTGTQNGSKPWSDTLKSISITHNGAGWLLPGGFIRLYETNSL